MCGHDKMCEYMHSPGIECRPSSCLLPSLVFAPLEHLYLTSNLFGSECF